MSAHRMSNADAAWLRMDRPTNLMVINAVLLFDEPLDWRARRGAILRERLVERFPRFRQRVVEPRAGSARRLGGRRRLRPRPAPAPRRAAGAGRPTPRCRSWSAT